MSSILRENPMPMLGSNDDYSLRTRSANPFPRTPTLQSPFRPQKGNQLAKRTDENDLCSPIMLTSPQALTGDLERDKMIHSLFYDPQAPALAADRNECAYTIHSYASSRGDSAEATSLVGLLVRMRPHVIDPETEHALGASIATTQMTRQGSLGKGTRIERPFNCRYGYNLSIGNSVIIGSGCSIVDSCSVIIGDKVTIGVKVILNCDSDVSHTTNTAKAVGRGIVLEDQCYVGPGAIILAGVRIGYGTKVLAGSVVFESFGPACVVGGNPAKIVG